MKCAIACKTCAFWMRKPNIVVSKNLRWDGSSWESKDYDGDFNHSNRETVKDLGVTLFGVCSSPKFVYTQAGDVPADDMATPRDGLGYSDGEAYGAYFYTGEDFGCIHHKEIE